MLGAQSAGAKAFEGLEVVLAQGEQAVSNSERNCHSCVCGIRDQRLQSRGHERDVVVCDPPSTWQP